MSCKVAIIGGGASGLTAAISAAQNGALVTIYESGERVGRKILATGNGRCNMTNINADLDHYHGENPKFILGVKNRFWIDDTLDFFSSLGIVAKTDDEGRVYPYSEQASAVLDVLRLRGQALGVKEICNFEVKSVRKNKEIFLLEAYDGRREEANAVIVATGGKASPSLGSKGGGYEILKELGHTITKLTPSLVQIKTEADAVRGLKGIRVNAGVTCGGKSEYGEVLFTDYGLSGIVIFSLSAYLGGQTTISLDIMPEYNRNELYEMLCIRIANNPSVTLDNFFVGMLNKRVGQKILKQSVAAPLSGRAGSLGEKEIRRIADIIKGWEFKITGTMSWNNAQVTRGGAVTDEFDSVTLESKKTKGLYACGEVLDIDGDCGGYNLQWAWASGYIAGQNAAKIREAF